MKKLLIASAALAMVAGTVQAQSSVTVYGIMDISLSKQGNQNTSGQDKTTVNSKDSSRIGFTGSESLGNGLTAIFTLEGGVTPGNGTLGNHLATTHTTAVTSDTVIATVANRATTTNTVTNTTNGTAKNRVFDRNSTVGLKGAFGQVTVGRQQNVIVDTNAKFDAMRAQFVGTNPFILYGAGNSTDTAGFGSGNADNLGVYRQDNSVKYQGTFSGLSVNAMQAFGAVTGDNAKYSSTGYGASYKFGMVEAGASTQEFKDANNQYSIKLNSYGAAINPMTGLVVRVQSAKAVKGASSEVTDKVNSIGATYAVAPKVDVTLAHYDVSRATAGTATDQDYKRNYLLVEYNLSKRTAVYGSLDKAKYSNVTSTFGGNVVGGSNNQSLMNVGVSHKF